MVRGGVCHVLLLDFIPTDDSTNPRFHREAVSASSLKVADAVMKKALLALRLDALKREMSLEVLWLMRNV